MSLISIQNLDELFEIHYSFLLKSFINDIILNKFVKGCQFMSSNKYKVLVVQGLHEQGLEMLKQRSDIEFNFIK